MLLALTALTIFSGNIILTKVASTRLALDAGFLVAIGANIGFAALLFALQVAHAGAGPAWNWPGVGLYAVAGAFTTWLGRWFFFESIARLGPARASVFQVSSPVFTVLIAWLVLGEALAARAIAGMAVTIAGLVLVSVSPRDLLRSAAGRDAGHVEGRWRRARHALVRSGLLLGLASSSAYAVGNVLRGAAIRRWDEPVLGALLGASAALAVHLAVSRGDRRAWRMLRGARRSGVALFALSGCLTISAQMCVISAMRDTPVAVVALVTLCTPLLVFPASYFLLGNQERITLRTVMGAGCTIGGIALLLLGA